MGLEPKQVFSIKYRPPETEKISRISTMTKTGATSDHHSKLAHPTFSLSSSFLSHTLMGLGWSAVMAGWRPIRTFLRFDTLYSMCFTVNGT